MPRGIYGCGAGGRGLTGGRGTGLGGGRGKVSLGRLPPVVHPVHAGKAVPVQQVRIQRLSLKAVLRIRISARFCIRFPIRYHTDKLLVPE